jgi:hypothetical protein
MEVVLGSDGGRWGGVGAHDGNVSGMFAVRNGTIKVAVDFEYAVLVITHRAFVHVSLFPPFQPRVHDWLHCRHAAAEHASEGRYARVRGPFNEEPHAEVLWVVMKILNNISFCPRHRNF